MKQTQTQTHNTTTNWLAVLVFAVLATAISAITREGAFDFYNTDQANIFTVLAFVVIFIGWGACASGIYILENIWPSK